MSDVTFYPEMASVAKANEIRRHVCRFPSFKVHTANNVMNVKCTAKITLMGKTPLASILIPGANRFSKETPSFSFSKFSGFYWSIIRMVFSFPVNSVAPLRAIRPASICFRFKCSVTLAALFAVKQSSRFFTFVGAFKRAMMNVRVRAEEVFATHSTINSSSTIKLEGCMAFARTKRQLTSFLIVRSSKHSQTLRTFSRLSENLRFKLARPSTINCSSSIGLKLFFTNRAGLNHG